MQNHLFFIWPQTKAKLTHADKNSWNDCVHKSPISQFRITFREKISQKKFSDCRCFNCIMTNIKSSMDTFCSNWTIHYHFRDPHVKWNISSGLDFEGKKMMRKTDCSSERLTTQHLASSLILQTCCSLSTASLSVNQPEISV